VRWVALALVIVAGCGGQAATERDPLRADALAFAADADRALDGTDFEGVAATDLADAIVDLCSTDATMDGAIERLGPAGAPSVEIAREVLVEALQQVCPTGDAAARGAFLVATREAMATAGGDTDLGDALLLTAGSSVCASLDAGVGVPDALLIVAAAIYGVEASSLEDLEVTVEQGVTLGAVLASAASVLCPEHAPAVSDFVEGL
jgi:hypothetical protein